MSWRHSWMSCAGLVIAAAAVCMLPLLGSSDSSGGDRPSGSSFVAAAEAPAAPAAPEDASDRVDHEVAAKTRGVRDRLQKKLTVSYEDVPLDHAITSLSNHAEVNAVIDRAALANDGIAIDTPLESHLPDVTVETALEILLPQLGLTWYLDGDVLKITTEANRFDDPKLETRVYDVRRLLRAMRTPKDEREIAWEQTVPIQLGGLGGGLHGTGGWYGPYHGDWPSNGIASLIGTIEGGTSGLWQSSDGIGGSISKFGNVLVVRQTPRVHDEIAAMLDALTDIATAKPVVKPRVVRPATYPFAEDDRARQAMQQRVDVDWNKHPLDEALAEFFTGTGIRHRIDRIALQNDGIALDTPIEFTGRKLTRAAILDEAFEPHGLTWIVRHGFVVVTSQGYAEIDHFTVLYDVRDLVARNDFGDLDFSKLIDVIEDETSGPWVNTPGSVSESSLGLLIVRHTDAVHLEIADMLKQLRLLNAVDPADRPDPDEIVTRQHQLPTFADADEFAAAVREFVAPDSWEGADGGRVRVVGNVLVVRNSNRVQREIRRFLRDLQHAAMFGGTTPGVGYYGNAAGTGFFRIGP